MHKPSAHNSLALYQYELPRYLPTADELPCSDDTPVDNELQEIIPSLLKSILRILWNERMDWFFGIDMGIYTDPERPPIVPDGFLCLNVERHYDEDLRLSYLSLGRRDTTHFSLRSSLHQTRWRIHHQARRIYTHGHTLLRHLQPQTPP